MADDRVNHPIVEPCYRCGGAVDVIPQDGGRMASDRTQYEAVCKCGMKEQNLGGTSGRRAVAMREWSRIAKSKRK